MWRGARWRIAANQQAADPFLAIWKADRSPPDPEGAGATSCGNPAEGPRGGLTRRDRLFARAVALAMGTWPRSVGSAGNGLSPASVEPALTAWYTAEGKLRTRHDALGGGPARTGFPGAEDRRGGKTEREASRVLHFHEAAP